MYFKVEKTSAVHQKLEALMLRIKEVEEASSAALTKVGAEKGYIPFQTLAGGLIAVYFPKGNPNPAVWVKFNHRDAYNDFKLRSCKANKAMIEEWAALPRVTNDEFNAIVNFKFQTTPSFKMLSRPGYEKIGEVYILKMDDEAKYDAPEGVVEITVGEYNRLKAEVKKEVTNE